MAASVSRALYDEVGRVAADMGYALGDRRPREDAPSGQRLPLEALLRRLTALEDLSRDPDIGLRVGRLLRPTAVGIPGYLAMAGPTLLEALPRVMDCQRLVADGVALHCTTSGETVSFNLAYCGGPPQRTLTDLLVAATRFFGAFLLASEPPLSDAWFHYPKPAATGFHEEIFAVRPRFGCSDDGFSLARSWFCAPLRTAQASLVPLLEAQATRLLASFRDDNFMATVTQAIVDLIAAGRTIDMSEVASRVHASPRTLQRRLQARGTTFNRLLQEVRMDMAERLLADRRLHLHDVAALLGYHEQSSFCHAYRQWTGRAPSQARREPPCD